MKEGTFNITSLENAAKRLKEILVRYQKDVSFLLIRLKDGQNA